MSSSFLAMQKNVFNAFRPNITQICNRDPIDVDIGEFVTVGPSLSAMDQPFWLKPGFMTSDHCSKAASKI